MRADARQLVTANAGCGKTYTLANRVIGWMIEHWRATGDIGIDGLLAATFTRKAAGEILERMLKHLAKGVIDADLRESYHATLGLEQFAGADEYVAVLESLTASIDAVSIGTLDSIFHRIASVCAGEIGLPAGWTMAAESSMKALRMEAIDDLLDTATQGHVDAIVLAAEEELLKGRGLDAIYEGLWTSGVMQVWQRSLGDRSAGAAWRWLLDLDDEQIAPGARLLSVEAIKSACATLEQSEVASTQAGAPNKTWLKARDKVVQHARDGRWLDLLSENIVKASMTGDTFSRSHAPNAFVDAVRPLASHGASMLARSLKSRMESWLLLLGGVNDLLSRLQHETGLYDFADIARHLSRANVLGDVTDQWIAFRLDTALRDIALDEFQDTSVEQFRVLEPIVRELFSGSGGHEQTRHLLVVADEKQSIYGWRGGTPELIDTLRTLGGSSLHESTLSRSWRSAPALMEFVDAVFGDVAANGVLLAAEQPPVDAPLLDGVGLGVLATGQGPVASALAHWPWTDHASAHEHMSGGVRVYQAPWAGRDANSPLDMAVEIAASRIKHAPSIGILVSTNDQVATIAAHLRALGIDASEEGGAKPKDLHAVNAVKSLLHLAEHPGDRLAAFAVSHSPLGDWAQLELLECIPGEDQAGAMARCARRIRGRVLQEGLDAVLADLVAHVRDECDGRNARALDQLVGVARRWSEATRGQGASLSAFLDHAMSSTLGGDSDGHVRVMTVHKSKGLEFDEVILPVLQPSLVREPSGCRIVRNGPLGEILAVAPSVNKDLRWAAPVLDVFRNQLLQRQYQDRLSGLYVAMTRARTGLHLVLQHHGKDIESTCSGGNLIRAAIPAIDQAISDRGAQEQGLIWSSGDDAWVHRTIDLATPPATCDPVRMRPVEVGPSTPPAQVELELVSGSPRREGIILHECLATIDWLDDMGTPAAAHFEQAFGHAAQQIGRPVGSDQRARLTGRLVASLNGPTGDALRRSAYANWKVDELEVLREVPLVHGATVQRLDRLVLGRRGGEVVRAAILDFKSGITDPNLAEDRYRPQLDAYVRRVSDTWRLPADAIDADLLLIDA